MNPRIDNDSSNNKCFKKFAGIKWCLSKMTILNHNGCAHGFVWSVQ